MEKILSKLNMSNSLSVIWLIIKSLVMVGNVLPWCCPGRSSEVGTCLDELIVSLLTALPRAGLRERQTGTDNAARQLTFSQTGGRRARSQHFLHSVLSAREDVCVWERESESERECVCVCAETHYASSKQCQGHNITTASTTTTKGRTRR